MPMTQLETSWASRDLFIQTIASLSDDTNWMVQTQTENSIILRRDKSFGAVRWVIMISYWLLVVVTLGIFLIFVPLLGFLFIGRSTQQIVIHTQDAGENTRATINYTKGASKAVPTIVDMARTG